MIDIYAIYTKDNPGKIKIQSVPAGSESGIHILNPTVKGDIGNATSMDFTVQTGTPYYGQFLQMRTYIQVDYDGDTIFYGRVITINNDFYGGEKLHCEGAIAFLNDSYFPGEKSSNKKTQTTLERITDLLNNHNSQVNDPLKSIYIGEVPGNYTDRTAIEQRIKLESREFGQSSWNNTKSALEDLKSHYGGAFRVRYENGACHLDWLNHYFRAAVRNQKIEIGKNLIDVTRATELSNIFTAIIPIGKSSSGDEAIYLNGYRTAIHGDNNYMTVPQIRKSAFPSSVDTSGLYTDSELDSGYHKPDDYRTAVDRYGMVFKTVEFQEAHSQEELFSKAIEWIKENYQGGVTTFSVKAIDLHLAGERIDKILLGDRVPLMYPVGNNSSVSRIEERTLTCTSAQYDLFNPENNQYTFGIPANMLGKTYGDSSDKKKKSSSYSPPKNDGDREPEDAQAKWVKSVKDWLYNHKFWYKSVGGKLPLTRASERGPSGNFYDGTSIEGVFLQRIASTNDKGESLWALLEPVVGGASIDPATKKTVYNWVKQNGLPKPNPIFRIYEDITAQVIINRKIIEYVMDEYLGFDLRKDLINKMPGVLTFEEGQKLVVYSGGDEEPVPEDATVLDIFNSNGVPVMKIQAEDGSVKYVEVDENGNPVLLDPDDPTKGYKYIDVRDIRRSTQELADELRALGHTVTLIDSQVTLIGQTVGDPTYGLVKEVANQGHTIAVISNDLIVLGSYMDQSMADFTAELTKMGKTVTDITSDVVNVGQKIDEETAKLTAELVAQGQTVTNITSDVTNITGRLNGHDARFDTIESDYLSVTRIANIPLLNVQDIATTKGDGQANFYSYYGRHFIQNVPVGGGEVRQYDLINGIGHISVTLTGNTYTLHMYTLSGTEIQPREGDVVTFSRATTLSGAWSGGIFTVSAAPQGETFTVDFPNTTTTNRNSITITPQSGTVKTYILENQGNNSVDLTTLSDGTNYVTVARITHGKYNSGWSAAYGKVSVPTTERTNVNSITVYTPPSTVDGSANGYTYGLYNNGNNAVDLQYINGSSYVTVARITHGKYNSGWSAAYGKVSVPTTERTNVNSITVYTPPSTVDGSANGYTYALYNSGDDAVVLQYVRGSSYTTVASIAHGKYTAGVTAGRNSMQKITPDYYWGQGGAHANDWWNYRAYDSNGTQVKYLETDRASAGIYLPIAMNVEFTSNGTFNPWSYTSEGGTTAQVFGPITVNVSGGGGSHSVSVTTYSSGYVEGSGQETSAKSAAATAMGCSTSSLDYRKLRTTPTKWTWCKASCGSSTKYVLIGF